MPKARDYIPALAAGYQIISQDIEFLTVQGTKTATAVGAGQTVPVTVNHPADQVFNLNTVPVVTTTTPNASVTVGAVYPDHFIVNVTNNGGAAQDIQFSYTRTGL